jgi:hypothetical protein
MKDSLYLYSPGSHYHVPKASCRGNYITCGYLESRVDDELNRIGQRQYGPVYKANPSWFSETCHQCAAGE